MMNSFDLLLKRLFDVAAAAAGMVVLALPMIAIACLVKLTSRGPVFFRQERVGRGGRPFFIYKFRTMVPDAPSRGRQITAGDDPRITRIGRLLRKTKLDEVPQLINVLRGDMSLVGPRPEVPRYVELFRDDYAEILKVRPGVTDLASLVYRDEASILGLAEDPEREYTSRVLPVKIRLAREYVARRSMWLDLCLLGKTVLVLMGFTPSLPSQEGHSPMEKHVEP
jgi:lipopolysaccharide/colanic/teichoic acid biosynthesis glycosyltransferase